MHWKGNLGATSVDLGYGDIPSSHSYVIMRSMIALAPASHILLAVGHSCLEESVIINFSIQRISMDTVRILKMFSMAGKDIKYG